MVCAACNEPIGSAAKVTSGDDVFHSACFKCSSCERPLAGVSYYTLNNSKVCDSCYGDKFAPECSACNKKVIGQSTKLGDGRNFHPECFICCLCEKPIATSFKTNSEGKFEHTPDCENTTASDDDKCIDCGKKLVNVKYFTLEKGDKCCADCYSEKHSSPCYVCQKPILEGQSHTVKDWKYHKECFNCPKENCGKYLGGRKIKLDGVNVVCFNCDDQ